MSLSTPGRRSTGLRWSHAAITVTVALLLANWKLLAGQVFEKWDAYDFSTPFHSLLADYARAGRFLYWNPWAVGGSPDFAIAGFGVFSPDELLFAVLTGPGATGLHIYWLAVWLLGGMGMLLLARHLQAPVWGGLVVSLGFIFSGFYTGHAEGIGLLYSYSLLPFVIWRLDSALLERRILAAAQAGALWGLSALAGYAAFTIYTIGLMVAWTVGRCFFAERMERAGDWKKALLILVTAGAIGVVVLSPSFVSALYEGRGYSDRNRPLPRSVALASNAFHPGALATFSSPSLVELKLAQRSLWAYTDVSQVSIYTGSVTLLLALIALSSPRQRRWRWFIFGIALFALICAMSEALPVRGWIYDLIPPTRYFRHSAELRGYFLFPVSILGLLGSMGIVRSRRLASRHFMIIAPALAITATIAFAIVTSVATVDYPEWLLTAAHFALIWGGLIIIALALRRWPVKMWRVLPALLIALALIDGLVACHLSEGTMYNNGSRPELPIPATSSIVLGPSGFRRALGTGRANVNLLFKVPTFNNYTPFKNRFHEAMVESPSLRAMALGDKRIWFVAQAPEVPLTDDSFAKFAARVTELNAPIIVRHKREAMLADVPSANEQTDPLSAALPSTSIPATIAYYQPEKVVFDAVAPSDGWLMITDRWSRSWTATVNGMAQPVWGANFIFRAVPVVQGNNRVEFLFHPFGLPAMVILSWTVLGIIGLLSLYSSWKRPKALAPRNVTEAASAGS